MYDYDKKKRKTCVSSLVFNNMYRYVLSQLINYSGFEFVKNL